jgi:formamidopyrimidine-DNA glycosylase
MPELPEVETVCRGLAKALAGKRIVRFEQRRADLRTPLPQNLAAHLKGRHILDIKRRAKYILIALDKNETLLLHLGMSGRMVITHKPSELEKHDHLIFTFDNGARLHFNDPRRFGMCDLVKNKDLPRHKLLRHLGIEPLEPGLTPAWLAAKLKGKKTSIKDALMDQRLIAGIGNIYACEALFYAGIDPRRRAGKCSKEQIARLIPAIRKVLKAAIEAGGSSLRDYRQADGELGYFQHHFAVYDREGKPCPGCTCDVHKTGGIRRITQGGRSSFYCKVKQV